MSVLLVSPKDKGNTYDVLNYVKNNSEAELLVLTENKACNLKEYETIIICSGVYGGNLHNNLRRWLAQIDKTTLHDGVRLHLFLTWFGRGRSDQATTNKVAEMLKNKDLNLDDDFITCYGGIAGIRHNHPNQEDYEKVLNWVIAKAQ